MIGAITATCLRSLKRHPPQNAILFLFHHLDQGVRIHFRDLHGTFPIMVVITPQDKNTV